MASLLGWLVVWRLRNRSRRREEEWSYTRLPGDARREILRTYVRVERLLGRKGLRPRGRSQTLQDYTTAAGRRSRVVHQGGMGCGL